MTPSGTTRNHGVSRIHRPQITVRCRAQKIAQPFGESLVEGAEQKVLDLGLSLFQRPHPRIGVVGLGRELADFGRHAVQSSGVFPDGRRDFSLVGARRVDGREDGSIVGLVRFQSGDPCSKLLQRRHGLILSGRSAGGSSAKCGCNLPTSCAARNAPPGGIRPRQTTVPRSDR
ncbi:Putative uncharacterized protein [Mycobacterium tuberculosis variant bovis]|uniref:Uncharacterized protein n=1 Tax=Mycobacterium tuberculosis (strain CDC 1551 / Oshkosh) TaxID=83331 RepID=Q8VIU2_MYCTO|nr:hypothetical protein MT3876 [Mycobacterium tuberculosis CDC1551]CEJ31332.1 Putative uncharacterized protein [Mycobacterium tuberculosis variant bovis]CEJ34861.1 Putative uncharacterized protein [Mycobacterium tuberculosis variant bovis]CEJ40897.1 Putative uncharacterized protein [Mycobacterium tuberculosis variant bovis]CEJ50003.1 Putative uncharacterized protein [Mycobacterium tuberculosis variant caprae]